MKNYNKRIQVCSYIKKVETAGIDFITIYKSDVCIHEEKRACQDPRRASSRSKRGVFLDAEGRLLNA